MQIHYFAAARQARGLATEEITEEFATVGDLVTWLGQNHYGTTQAGSSFAEVLSKCSFLIDGKNADLTTTLPNAYRVDVLPPFAGG